MPSNAVSIEENEVEVRSPSRTEKPIEKHKKDVKNFVDTRITNEKTWTGEESKENPDSPMRTTQFARFSLGIMDSRPSPEV